MARDDVKKVEIPKWCWVYGFQVVTDARPDVKHQPIMFKSPMVRAILEGRKTQTRRPVKQAIPEDADEVFFWAPGTLVATTMPRVAPSGLWVRRNDSEEGEDGWVRHLGPSPYGLAGDRLWVRETWARWVDIKSRGCIVYAAGGDPRSYLCSDGGEGDPVGLGGAAIPSSGEIPRWRPSIHMPRWASRLTLEIVSVRVERVEAISEVDARAEGVQRCGGFMATTGCWMNYGKDGPSFYTARESYLSLWRSMYGS